MTDEYQGLFADADGTKLHYYDVGQGEPLILLHGGGAGASGLSNWRRNIGPLSKHFRVLTVDQPGYGLSDNKIGSEGLFVEEYGSTQSRENAGKRAAFSAVWCWI